MLSGSHPVAEPSWAWLALERAAWRISNALVPATMQHIAVSKACARADLVLLSRKALGERLAVLATARAWTVTDAWDTLENPAKLRAILMMACAALAVRARLRPEADPASGSTIAQRGTIAQHQEAARRLWAWDRAVLPARKRHVARTPIARARPAPNSWLMGKLANQIKIARAVPVPEKSASKKAPHPFALCDGEVESQEERVLRNAPDRGMRS